MLTLRWNCALTALLLSTLPSTQGAMAAFMPITLSSLTNARIQDYQPSAVGYPEGPAVLGGVPFAIHCVGGNNAWNSEVLSGPYPRSVDIPLNVSGAVAVHTLLNTFYGQPGPTSYVWLEFFGSQGAYYRKDLIGNVDIRDHFYGNWTNSINGTTTTMVYTSGGGPAQESRLDKQYIALPPEFAGQTLYKVRITADGGVGISDASLSGLTVVAAAAPQFGFGGLGDLPGGSLQSNAAGISADGNVICGLSVSANGTEAARWQAGALSGLGDLQGGSFHSEAYAVSADGRRIVGRGSSDLSLSSPGDREACYWDNGLAVAIGDLSGGIFLSEASDVSATGSVIVGRGFSTSNEAFRWSAGVMTGLGDLPGGSFESLATAVSNDGRIVVGYSNATGGYEPFRWENGTMLSLGDLPGGVDNGSAADVSADGRVIVGSANSANGTEAFRWEAGIMAPLGDLAGGAFASGAAATSANGAIVVGGATSTIGSDAFIWTAGSGMRSLRDVLTQHGVTSHQGWQLLRATAIADDGATILGDGVNVFGYPEAWVAKIPAICTGDLNWDMSIDLADLSIVLSAYGATGHSIGDLDGDLIVDLHDLTAILSLFGSPCP